MLYISHIIYSALCSIVLINNYAHSAAHPVHTAQTPPLAPDLGHAKNTPCPDTHCLQRFKSRYEAKNHYQNTHTPTKKELQCRYCTYSVSKHSLAYFNSHILEHDKKALLFPQHPAWTPEMFAFMREASKIKLIPLAATNPHATLDTPFGVVAPVELKIPLAKEEDR